MSITVEMTNINKVFPGVVANDSVSLTLNSGQIIGIIGENGAGKTTLMNILYGLYHPDSGQIKINGREVKISSPRSANELGIGMVHQHFRLVPSFTVLENIILGLPTRRGFLDLKKAKKKLLELSEAYHLQCLPEAVVHTLPVGMKQKVEILKALYRGSDLLILDEPTGVLTPREIKDLFVVLKALKKEGKTIVLVTHKLGEIMVVTDRVVVMRKGRVVSEVATSETDDRSLARMMVGRDVAFNVRKDPMEPGEVMLKIERLSAVNDWGITAVDDVSFEIRRGEILGLAGVEGNGQSELIDCLTGLRPARSGKITMGQVDVTGLNPKQIRELSVSHIPEDRMIRGVNTAASVWENLIANRCRYAPFSTKGFLNSRMVFEESQALIEHYHIDTPSRDTKVSNLSGGNIQKLIIAREIHLEPGFIIIAHPSRGVDVGAIEFIHEKIMRLRRQGSAVLLVSSELSELISLCDRILVMYRGRFNGECLPDQVSEKDLGVLIAGANGGGHG
ncbi:MAG: ABC transporter ATP-binding protein [Deltaproteobacteria bacterium]|nr:ABC transporter ATP-binding protein [Deltaproteobacteria bacterium]